MTKAVAFQFIPYTKRKNATRDKHTHRVCWHLGPRWAKAIRSADQRPQLIGDALSSLPKYVPINSLCAEVEREVHVAHVAEVVEDVPNVFGTGPEGKIANQQRHLARRTVISPTITRVLPTVPSPITVTAHGCCT